jgi:hypothetical protein
MRTLCCLVLPYRGTQSQLEAFSSDPGAYLHLKSSYLDFSIIDWKFCVNTSRNSRLSKKSHHQYTGKGHIGVALAAHGIPSVLLDPQAPLPTESSANYSIREEGNESTDSSAEAKNAGLVGYQRVIQESLMDDGSTLLNGTESLEATGEVTPVGEILRRCSIVVGMHPDQVKKMDHSALSARLQRVWNRFNSFWPFSTL